MDEPELAVCANCRRPVDYYSTFDGDGNETRTAIHANHLGDIPPHEVVPIPRANGIEVVTFCDFCGASHPTVWFPARSFEDRSVQPYMVSQSAWLSCEKCAPLVDAKNWSAVLDRYLKVKKRRLPDRDRPAMLAKLTVLWEHFARSRLGPSEPA